MAKKIRRWCFLFGMYLPELPHELNYEKIDVKIYCEDCPHLEKCKEYAKELEKAIREGRSILGFE